MKAAKFVPGAVVFLTALYFLGAMIPARDAEDGFHFQKFGQLPIVDRGRFQPVDTFARTNLMLVSEQQSFKEFNKWQDFLDRNTKPATALKWLLDTLAFSEPIEFVLGEKDRDRMPAAFNHRVIRIENDQVLSFLELEPRPGF